MNLWMLSLPWKCMELFTAHWSVPCVAEPIFPCDHLQCSNLDTKTSFTTEEVLEKELLHTPELIYLSTLLTACNLIIKQPQDAAYSMGSDMWPVCGETSAQGKCQGLQKRAGILSLRTVIIFQDHDCFPYAYHLLAYLMKDLHKTKHRS